VEKFEDFFKPNPHFTDREKDLPNVIILIKIQSLFTLLYILAFLPNGFSSYFSLYNCLSLKGKLPSSFLEAHVLPHLWVVKHAGFSSLELTSPIHTNTPKYICVVVHEDDKIYMYSFSRRSLENSDNSYG